MNWTFEQVFTYASLGLVGMHKLVNVASWAAGALTPDDNRDDAFVARIDNLLTRLDTVLNYIPMPRTKASK